jgi:PAS domain S-box-containing protein
MRDGIKIVHLDDSLEDTVKARETLNKRKVDCEIRVVSNRAEFSNILTDFVPDIILSEYMLSDIHCSEALTIARDSGIEAPFIIVSGDTSDEVSEELLRIGADDYVTKDQLWRLPFAITKSLEKHHLKIKELESASQLTNSEKLFRTLIEFSTDAVVVLNPRAQPIYVSPAVKTVLGYTPREIVDMGISAIAHPDDEDNLAEVMTKVLANPGVPIQGHTGRMRHKDGSWRWIEATVTNLLHEPGINGIVDNFRDVTDKKIGETKIVQINRLYAFLSQVNHSMVFAGNEKAVFKELCRIACETGEFKAAWVWMIDASNDKIDLVEARGISEEELAQSTGAIYELIVQNGILHSGRHLIYNDAQQDPLPEDLKLFAASSGFGSGMILPFKRFGKVVGTFILCAEDPEFFTEGDTALLEETVSGISFTLEFFEQERLRLLADGQLRDKERRLSQAQAIAHLGSWETDILTNVSIWSEEACRICGLPENENIQTPASWITLVHPDDITYVTETNKRILDTKQGADFYHRIIRSDGQVRYLRVQAHLELNSLGEPVSLYGVMHDVTEIEKSQQALRSSEHNLRAIFENSSEGFILTDTEATVRYFNRRAEYFFRLTTGVEITLGASLYDAARVERRADFRKTITSVLSGTTRQYEHLYEQADGQEKWLNVTFTPVYDNDQIVGLSLTAADITDQKLAQDLLQRSESNLNAIMNNTDALIYSLDTNLRYITYNHAFKTMMKERYGIDVQPGYDIRESINKYDPGAEAEWEQINDRALGGEILKFEKELPYNETYSYLRFSIHPIRKSNTVTGLSCFVNDITREKLAEEKVLKAFEEKNVILESIGDAFYAVDRDWIVTYWNKQAEILLKCPKEKILGKYVWDVFPDVVDTLFHKSYQKAFETNTIQHFEAFYEKDQAWFEVTAYPSSGGLSIYLREITERKHAESQLYELNESLLKYADELIASNKGLEQFSYIVSHNLRAPVANIIGLGELVEQDIYPPEAKQEFIKGILVNVERLDEVVSDLNTILQIKREVSEKLETVYLQHLVDNIRSSIHNIIEKEHVEIHTDFDTVEKLFTLKSYLYSIFYNLIMNSIKYRQREIDPVIRIKSRLEQGQVVISVQDNGMGIDLIKKGSQVFGLYKRFHHHVEGKGMGLFMVKTQVEMLGGKIAVSSEVNKGTEFTIEFRSNDYQIPVV